MASVGRDNFIVKPHFGLPCLVQCSKVVYWSGAISSTRPLGTIVRAIRPFFAPVSLSQGPRHKRELPWHPFLPLAFTRALVRRFVEWASVRHGIRVEWFREP